MITLDIAPKLNGDRWGNWRKDMDDALMVIRFMSYIKQDTNLLTKLG